MMKKYGLTIILLAESFFTTWALMKAGRFEPGNILTFVFFLFSFIFYRHVHKISKRHIYNKRHVTVSLILSLFYTIFYMAADYLRYIETLSSTLFRTIILTAVFLGFFSLFFNIIFYLNIHISQKEVCSRYLSAIPASDSQGSTLRKRLPAIYASHCGLITFLLCIICWLPYFLYQFPAIMTPDSINQFEQVLGIIPYSNHHPLAHTMLFKLLYSIGGIFTDSMVIRVAFYTFFQMCVMALAAAYLIRTLQKLNIRMYLCIIITCFYALVPYNAVFAVTIWKDVLFAAFTLLLCTAALRLYLTFTYQDISFTSGKLFFTSHNISFPYYDMAIYILSAFLFCLMRSNGWYAFLLSLPFLLLLFRKQWKQMLPLHLLVLVTVVIIKGPIMTSHNVIQPDFVESISIPIQQISSVICNDRELTSEQWELVHNVIDTTYIKELYVPNYADNIKELVRAGNPGYLSAHKGDYLKLWISLGLKYPGDYLNAYIQQTIGYWYPDSFYTVADTEGISASSLGVSQTPIIKGWTILKIKEISIKLGSMLPLYSLIWSMGVLFWVLLFCIGCGFSRNEKWKLAIYMPSLAGVLTILIATPVATDFRYVYFLVYSIPFYLILALLPVDKNKRP